MPKPSLEIPHFRQSKHNTCLPACVRMTLAYYGHLLDEPTLERLLETKSFGTTARNIQRVTALGFSAAIITQ